MKSREVMQRIERAGWRVVRQAGSHITFERKGKRVVYGIGRPQDDVGKNRLREIVRDFSLEKIEREAAADRIAESNREAAELAQRAAARVAQRAAAAVVAERERDLPHLNGELTYAEMHVLYAQLHRDHGYTMTRLSNDVGIVFKKLSEYVYGQRATLSAGQLATLRAWFLDKEVKLLLTRDRQTLLDRGYGVRTGSINERDPRLAKIGKALAATGRSYADLDREIFGTKNLVGSIVRGQVKRIFPANMARLEAWYERHQAEERERKLALRNEDADLARMRTEIVEPMHPPTKVVPETPVVAEPASFENELRAVEAVMRAVSTLPHKVAKRVLGYAVQRLEEG